MSPRDGIVLTCVGCGWRWCPDDTTSPGEDDSLCLGCWDLEDCEAVT